MLSAIITRSSQSRSPNQEKKESPLWTWERSSKSEEIGRNHLLGLKKNNVSTGLTVCVQIEDLSHLDGVVSLGEVDLLLLLLLGDARSILLAQSSADGTGLLCAEVEGKVLLVLVEDAQLRALVDVDDGQDASDGLADVVAIGKGMSENLFVSRIVCVRMSFRCFPLIPSLSVSIRDAGGSVVHSGELALGTTGDLLGAELNQLGLQLLELSLELILVLAPELAGLDLSGRLR